MTRRRWALSASAALLALAGAGCSTPATTPLWADEFDGQAGAPPDPATWTPQTGGHGWGNDELECYTDAASEAQLDGQGHLVITASRQPGHVCADGAVRDYVSARLSTEGLRTFTHSRLEMRAKLPTGMGIWPAFWALGEDHATVGWPMSGEIDITEVIGREPSTTNGSVHGPAADGSPFLVTRETDLRVDLSEAFHVYSATWTPTSIDFAVDGIRYATIDKAAVQEQGAWVYDKPFYLLLNVAVGGRWPGPPDATTTWPQQMVVDYVRVYPLG